MSKAREAEKRLRQELAIDRVSSVKSEGRFEEDVETVLNAFDRMDRCMVVRCDRADDLTYLEPIYVAKVDQPFEKDNIVVCRSVLCHEHAALLSWSI